MSLTSVRREVDTGSVKNTRREGIVRLSITFALALVVALLMAGCGGERSASSEATRTVSTTVPRSTAAASQRGFLALASNGALFIQWTRTGDTVTGTLSEAFTSLSDPTQPQSESHPFTGVISGSDVTLTIDSSENWNGTLNGSNVTLSYTSSDGSLRTFDFHPASVADYNAAVASVRGRAAGAKQRQAQREALAELKQRIENEGANVASDLQQLAEDVASVQDDVKSIGEAVATASEDTQGTLKEMRSVLAEAVKYPDRNYGSVCADASSVGADANGVEADENSVEASGQSLDYDLDRVASDITTLVNDSQSFQSDHEALPSYQPSSPVDQSAVAKAITRAHAASASARKARAAHIAKAKQLVRTANGYAAQAQAACDKTG